MGERRHIGGLASPSLPKERYDAGRVRLGGVAAIGS